MELLTAVSKIIYETILIGVICVLITDAINRFFLTRISLHKTMPATIELPIKTRYIIVSLVFLSLANSYTPMVDIAKHSIGTILETTILLVRWGRIGWRNNGTS